jgi:hypothetical protein
MSGICDYGVKDCGSTLLCHRHQAELDESRKTAVKLGHDSILAMSDNEKVIEIERLKSKVHELKCRIAGLER